LASAPPRGALGAPDARPRRGTGQETLVRDRVAAPLAYPVTPLAQSNECAIDIFEVRTRLIDERGELRALEPDGRAFGIMLVVGGLECGRLHDAVELAGELPDSRRGLVPIGPKLAFEPSEILG
jgi:hypothetical protein